MSRDLVAFIPRERVDMPDFTATQRNSRSDTRASLNSILFGNAATKTRILGGFAIAANGPPSSIVDVSGGTGLGAEVLPDGTVEYGVEFGEGSATQELDFNGKANNTYNVYIRFRHSLGESANRVIRGTVAEEIAVVQTRAIVGWDVQAATSSPGDGWFKIAEVVWAGVDVETADITMTRHMFFEGDEATDFAVEWGDGANDRNLDRGLYGVKDLYTWVHAIERRIMELHDITVATPWHGDGSGVLGGLSLGTMRQTSFQLEEAGETWTADEFAHSGDTFLDGEAVQWNSLVLRKIAIAGIDFHMEPQVVGFFEYSVISGGGVCNVLASVVKGKASLAGKVPHGTRISTWTMNVRNGTPLVTGPVTIVATLYKVPHDTGVRSSMFSLTYDSNTDPVGSDVAKTAAPTLEALDYDTNYYFIEVVGTPDASSNDGEVTVRGFEITYQNNKLYSDGADY